MGGVSLTNRLKDLRKEKGLTTRELAEIYGVSHASISRAETGDRNLNEQDIEFFTKFFDVSADYLLGISNERKNTIQIIDMTNAKDGVTKVQMDVLKKIEDLNEKDIEKIMDYIDYIKSKGDRN